VHFKLSHDVKKKSIFVAITIINNIPMSKEEFLTIVESYYAEFEALKESPNFYDYEKSLAQMMQKLFCE